MKFWHLVIFFTSLSVAFAAVPAAEKTVPQKTVTTKKAATKATASSTKAGARVVAKPGKGSSAKRRSVSSTRASASTWRTRQQAPTLERYKQIQQALAAKGYLKSEPNGVWDTQSVDALKQFQTDQKLAPSGKINAASLIGLGLGGTGSSVAPSAPPAELPAGGETPRPDLSPRSQN